MKNSNDQNAFDEKTMLRNSLNKDLKKTIIKVFVLSLCIWYAYTYMVCVWYAFETWCLTKEDIKSIEAMEVWIWINMKKS